MDSSTLSPSLPVSGVKEEGRSEKRVLLRGDLFSQPIGLPFSLPVGLPVSQPDSLSTMETLPFTPDAEMAVQLIEAKINRFWACREVIFRMNGENILQIRKRYETTKGIAFSLGRILYEEETKRLLRENNVNLNKDKEIVITDPDLYVTVFQLRFFVFNQIANELPDLEEIDVNHVVIGLSNLFLGLCENLCSTHNFTDPITADKHSYAIGVLCHHPFPYLKPSLDGQTTFGKTNITPAMLVTVFVKMVQLCLLERLKTPKFNLLETVGLSSLPLTSGEAEAVTYLLLANPALYSTIVWRFNLNQINRLTSQKTESEGKEKITILPYQFDYLRLCQLQRKLKIVRTEDLQFLLINLHDLGRHLDRLSDPDLSFPDLIEIVGSEVIFLFLSIL